MNVTYFVHLIKIIHPPAAIIALIEYTPLVRHARALLQHFILPLTVWVAVVAKPNNHEPVLFCHDSLVDVEGVWEIKDIRVRVYVWLFVFGRLGLAGRRGRCGGRGFFAHATLLESGGVGRRKGGRGVCVRGGMVGMGRGGRVSGAVGLEVVACCASHLGS